jgi:hypothetical protein
MLPVTEVQQTLGFQREGLPPPLTQAVPRLLGVVLAATPVVVVLVPTVAKLVLVVVVRLSLLVDSRPQRPLFQFPLEPRRSQFIKRRANPARLVESALFLTRIKHDIHYWANRQRGVTDNE